MKNLYFNKDCLLKISLILFSVFSGYTSSAQHIQYRDKTKPVNQNKNIPETPESSILENTLKTKTAEPTKEVSEAIADPGSKRKYIEEQNNCSLSSNPRVAPQLPVIFNNVSSNIIKKLKERYAGRLYSITGLDMIDERLKYKLKICDNDNGKFRSEYLDKHGKVVNDPNLDYE